MLNIAVPLSLLSALCSLLSLKWLSCNDLHLSADEGGSTYVESTVQVMVPAPENFLSNTESLIGSLSSSETAGEAESLIAGMASTMQSVGMHDEDDEDDANPLTTCS